MKRWIAEIIDEKIALLERLGEGYVALAEGAGERLASVLKNGGKILLAGNGGSAADAQHFAGEIVGRFTMERKSLPALSLCVDPSVMTCIGNDYGYGEVFARQLEGIGRSGDAFVAISTSGNSENLVRALRAAKAKGMATVGFLGRDGGKMKPLCDFPLIVPSSSTPRIQETHTLTVHILCQLIEQELFGGEGGR